MPGNDFSGPLRVYGGGSGTGPATGPNGGRLSPDNNPDRGPSLFDMGVAMADPRPQFAYAPGQRTLRPIYGFPGVSYSIALDVVPAAAAANNIAASQTPTVGTPLVLAAGPGVTSAMVQNTATGRPVSGLVLDGPPGGFPFGAGTGTLPGSHNLWDPTKQLSRTVRITSAGNDSGGTFVVRGLDVYGYPLTQTVTGGNAGVASTTKAFKTILSVTPAGTLSGSAVTVGTNDVFGLPLRVDQFPYATIWWANALITSPTGLTPAVTTNPSTALTGDVRGTYAVQSASDGTKKLIVFLTPQVSNLGPDAATGNFFGLFGMTQV